ncbi:HAD-IIA family hydrolase [Paenibacillus sp. GD4]|uniref:HAD-IIA family hydrolase n=1 Tax=Paenibacillus sp. GD4 TaxID=3068890 RepID=UPI002796474E|nr:HAD-IIA family hydrolase [Paenibacillus sp. GD4]MDQ1911109.1 HAD-IIA family hydrolase [Paenibacillus sp. GD4]
MKSTYLIFVKGDFSAAGFFVAKYRWWGEDKVEMTAYDGYCFDLDGTIYLEGRLLPDVRPVLSELRRRSKGVMFLTNTSIWTRQDCKRRLEALGIACEIHEIMSAAYAAGQYLKESAPDAKVLLIAESAMGIELREAGIGMTQDPLLATHVLVGMDRAFTYEKLHQGMKAVRHGAKLMAANPDPCCPVIDDLIPDTGALLKALETASQAEMVTVIGKPNPYMAHKALQKLGIPAERCLMIGDRLETDILLGRNSGMKTALVLTGIATQADIAAFQITPDYVLKTLGELIGPGKQVMHAKL